MNLDESPNRTICTEPQNTHVFPKTVTHQGNSVAMIAVSATRSNGGLAPIRVASMNKAERGTKPKTGLSPVITQKYESETSTKGLPGNQTASGLRNKS